MKARKVNEESVKSNAKQEPDVWGSQDSFQCVFKVTDRIERWWPGISGSYPIGDSWLVCKNQTGLSGNLANYVPAPLILVRGLPGSGKSKFAKELKLMGRAHFETDQFFYKRGKYVFDVKRIQEAHAWCLDLARRALKDGDPVVVSNTFVHKSTMTQYIQLDATTLILEMTGTWQNIHGVTDEVIAKMRDEWESLSF